MVVLYFANELAPVQNPMFDIEKDGGYAERFQYVKLFSIVVLLIWIAWKNRAVHYVAWALAFTYLLFDDSMQLHERVGRRIAESLALSPALGLRARDFGELLVTAAAGFFLAAVLLWAYRTGSRSFKKVSQDIILLILLLVFFGVVVDMAHVAFDLGWQVTFVLGIVEDGGEMLAVSLILSYVYLTKVRGEDARWYLSDSIRGVITRRFA
jgi:hypothetical protein